MFSTNILAQEIIGIPKIVDGDTVSINNYKIRLEGIDAPEMKQKCKKEKRTALITYTVAGDNTKNNSLKITYYL